MHRRENIIGYVRGLPRLSEERQIRLMEAHGISDIIIDGRRVWVGGGYTVEDWNTLCKKIKPGDTVAVMHTRVLVPEEVWRFQHDLAKAFAALESVGTKKKPVIIWELQNDWRSNVQAQRDKMWTDATEDYQRVARYDRAGRPSMNWSEAELALVDRHWFNVRKHETNRLAAEAVREGAKRENA
jgi:hypothetical protein